MSNAQDRWDAAERDYKAERDTPDFDLINHGSICLLTPRTPAGHDWAAVHLPANVQLWGLSNVVEPRYVPAIIEAVEADGLTVESLDTNRE
jgi:hypothetical protein